MPKLQNNKKAYSILEYIVMILVVITALLLFKFFIQRAYQGQMAKAGEVYAFGRLYSPTDTIVCIHDGVWYSEACFDHALGINPNVDLGTAKAACTAGCPAP